MTTVKNAEIFATAAHMAAGNVRKFTGEPYIVHPASVVDTLKHYMNEFEGVPNEIESIYRSWGDKYLTKILAAAWLHDTVEDTGVTIENIELHFGTIIRNWVEDLTKEVHSKDVSRAFRKSRECEKLKTIRIESKLIKIADIFDNTKDLLKIPDKKYALTLANEKKAQLDAVYTSECGLWSDCNKQIEYAIIRLKIAKAGE